MTHTLDWYENYAKENGLVLGKNAKKIIQGVDTCEGHCPCKYTMMLKNNPDKLDTIICPCEDHLKEIDETGHCHCTLFYREK